MPVKAPIHPGEWPSRPWARVHTDHAGRYLRKTFKWIEAHLIDSTSLSATVAVLCSVFAVHGILEQLVSDNGSEFKEFFEKNGIHHTFTSLYHPSSNGLAEPLQTVKLNDIKVIKLNWRYCKVALIVSS